MRCMAIVYGRIEAYLYDGRLDKISLRFWESVTLSTDSWESSLSAMVDIWQKQKHISSQLFLN